MSDKSVTLVLRGKGQKYTFKVSSTKDLNEQAIAVMDSPNSDFGLDEYGALWFMAGKAKLDEICGEYDGSHDSV